MKRLIPNKLVIMVSALLISTGGFADINSHSAQLKALGSAWKTKQSVNSQQTKNDITMVYGGADVSRRPTLVSHIATA